MRKQRISILMGIESLEVNLLIHIARMALLKVGMEVLEAEMELKVHLEKFQLLVRIVLEMVLLVQKIVKVRIIVQHPPTMVMHLEMEVNGHPHC